MRNFVVIAHERSGSFMLASALGRQRHVQMHLELFNPYETNRRTHFPVRHPDVADDPTARPSEYYRTGASGADFLAKFVYHTRYPTPIQAVGFKLLYGQAGDTPGAETAWRYLAAARDTTIVHLQRSNLLAALVSLKVARATNQWRLDQRSVQSQRRVPPIRLAPDECAAYFAQVNSQHAQVSAMFADHPTVALRYEQDLLARFDTSMRKILDALHVPIDGPLQPLTRQQSWYRLKDQLLNYAELERHFAATPAAEYFA